MITSRRGGIRSTGARSRNATAAARTVRSAYNNEPGAGREPLHPVSFSNLSDLETSAEFKPGPNRSRFITLVHAATKSFANFSFASVHA